MLTESHLLLRVGEINDLYREKKFHIQSIHLLFFIGMTEYTSNQSYTPIRKDDTSQPK